jgi:hypothetical protein
MKPFPLSTTSAVAPMPPPLAFRITSGSVTAEFRPATTARRTSRTARLSAPCSSPAVLNEEGGAPCVHVNGHRVVSGRGSS